MVRGPIGYAWFFWVIFTVSMTLCVLDRFTTNVWPRNDFNQPRVGDSVFKPEGPWSAIFFSFFSKFSGRYTMLALSFLYFTMMHTTHFYLTDTWIGRLIDFGDFVNRVRVHRYVGISIAIVTLIHVWSITFPVIFSRYSIEVRPGHFAYPLSESTPEGFKDLNITAERMMMQVDDVYRLILMSVLLGPVVYFSVKWMSSHYRLGIRVHQFVMLMYFIDIVRRHSHPHCWVINVPFFLAWLLDTFWGHYFRHERTSMRSAVISSNYMIFYWNSTVSSRLSSIGDVFYMRTKCTCCCRWERSHPFTCLTRRKASIGNMQSFVRDSNPSSENEPDSNFDAWNRAALVRTYTSLCSHTREMREDPDVLVDIWGGFRFGTIANYVNSKENIVLVGGGSGAMFMIDTLLYIATSKKFQKKDTKKSEGSKVWHTASQGSSRSNPQLTNFLFRNSKLGTDFPSNGPPQYPGTRDSSNGSLSDIEREMADDLAKNLDFRSSQQWHIVGVKDGEETPEKVPKKKVIGMIYTSNDAQLVQWFANFVDDVLARNTMPTSVQLHLTIALTGGHCTSPKFTEGKVVLGRCDFAEEISRMTAGGRRKCHLFCQGGVSLQNAVRDAAFETGKTYHEAHSFDNAQKSKRSSKTCCLRC